MSVRRPGADARRRNRNDGQPWRGHGQDNRLVVPSDSNRPWVWHTTIGEHHRSVRRAGGRDVQFIVEPAREDCVHACSEDDVCGLLSALPVEDWQDIAFFVLRQPSRKQEILRPAWGRLSYWGNIGQPNGTFIAEGSAVFLEAVRPGKPFRWRIGLSPDDQEELERLRADGHAVERQGGRWVITPTREAARATQLFRTLPHEIGHWVDWTRRVRRPAAEGGDWGSLQAEYFARPSAERDAFAHRYAGEMRSRLEDLG